MIVSTKTAVARGFNVKHVVVLFDVHKRLG